MLILQLSTETVSHQNGMTHTNLWKMSSAPTNSYQFINPSARVCTCTVASFICKALLWSQRWEGLTWKASHQQIVIRDILHHSNVTLASGSRRSTVVLPPGSWAPYPQVRDESSSYTTLWHACWSRTQIHIDLPGEAQNHTKPLQITTISRWEDHCLAK